MMIKIHYELNKELDGHLLKLNAISHYAMLIGFLQELEILVFWNKQTIL